ncbi:4-hydroxybenzoate octaprenyltransferase [Pacificibacter marinus]|uniref:4-hydroxybenzoate octaprenyltransferase n=1 Tax=Pacificibacter marinus TaxID=658057 RepID=A0A1Y5TGC5_9RHOB|nr:4-hydroxybenzoate octaprenyltransferase [Pacificibacter marinus]SEL17540.1 4-hydroxybenzoate polyprenyltransferase [Pacificibacter marinus]SLN63358.1 4-hydroxybenzoate octaprenyltransferase [Pacificibacter marinus]
MTDKRQAPDLQDEVLTGQVADAVKDNWVDTRAPAWTRPYLRLSRADRPIGTWLLLLPCWWGALLAASVAQELTLRTVWIMVGCAFGAWLMRGAGCTWNDITDRKFDAQVARTKSRPLPSGQITTKQAALWMAIQCLIAFCILISFGQLAIVLGFVSLIPVAVYPFAKRFTWWPQVFLGLAFNWGALLAYAAVAGDLSAAPVFLYLSGIAWTLFYDTIYAHQDKDDDALIGIKSTARLFGIGTARWLKRFLIISIILFAAAVIEALITGSMLSLILALGGAWAMGWHMTWQLSKLDIDNPDNCLMLFRSNRNAGLLAALFLAISVFV